MERKFKMFCIKGVNEFGEVVEDLISLFFEVDNKIVDSCCEDNIGDIIVDSYNMLNRNCEKFGFDGRRDKLEINLKYEW
jgi:hypothetical protein